MTWNRTNVATTIIELFTKHRQSEGSDIAAGEVTESAKIVADLGIDSLGVMEVLSEVEDTFGLLIPDDSLKSIETVGHVIAAITEKLEQGGRLSE
jgi:acyl carrier protein